MAQMLRKKQIFSGRTMWVVLTVLLVSRVPVAEAQTAVGGHIGFVLPLVTHAAGTTTNIADHFSIGFPLGITFKGSGRMAYDLELVPGVQGTPRQTNLTVHPGFVWAADTVSVSGCGQRSTSILRNGDLRRW